MWTKIGMAAIVAGLLGGTAAAAYAQGSMTQDPGRMAPGNLTRGSAKATSPRPPRDDAAYFPHWRNNQPSLPECIVGTEKQRVLAPRVHPPAQTDHAATPAHAWDSAVNDGLERALLRLPRH